jgi:hypothetical protein
MPIIAGRASAAYGAGFGKVLGGAAFEPVGAYDALSTVTVPSGGLSSITFAGIPTTGYSHLQLRWTAKTDRAEYDDAILMQFNEDTASNYSWHFIRGNGSLAGSAGSTSQSRIAINYGATGNSGATNSFSVAIMDILDYSNVNKFKTIRCLNGIEVDANGIVYLHSGNYRSTSAITSITLDQQYSSNFVQYSQFALYGVK